jgi:hypothetical protein
MRPVQAARVQAGPVRVARVQAEPVRQVPVQQVRAVRALPEARVARVVRPRCASNEHTLTARRLHANATPVPR